MFDILVFVLILFAEVSAYNSHDDIIEYVESLENSTWQAGPTSLTEYDFDTLAVLSGSKTIPWDQLSKQPIKSPGKEVLIRLSLPANFDPRLNWPNCQSLKEIRNQGMCGSCWAHAGVSVMSDRICIASAGQNVYTKLAVQDPLVCSGGTNNLCNGGYVDVPYTMAINRGIVTGGDYGSGLGCMPYQAYPSAVAVATTPTSCNNTCWNPLFSRTYTQDKYFASTYYAMGNLFTGGPTGGAAVTVRNESVIKQIQYELMTNGPMTAIIQVYQDLYSYQSGVYQHVTGGAVGGHAIKIMGWGTENNVDYWLLANSWGTGWGIGGFFKFIRGINHLGIEDYLITGLAKQVTTTTGATTATTTTTTTTTTTPYTTPPKSGRPAGYDRCDSLFCFDKAGGNYQLSPCSRNYCKCNSRNATFQRCDVGMYYDKVSSTCKSPSAGFCAPKPTAPLSTANWTAAPSIIAKACNLKNCQGRGGGDYTWYTLGLCTPYWCYCWSDIRPPQQAVQTCPTGMLFDFRTEKAHCAPPSDLVWCA